MNQSILFPELQKWQEYKSVVTFPAQQLGHTIDCLISIESLAKLKGDLIKGENNALQTFSEYRFDIEELIENEDFNQLGQIVITL